MLTGRQLARAVPADLQTPNVIISSSHFGLDIHHLYYPVPAKPWVAGVQRFYWFACDNRSLAVVTYKEAQRQVTPAGNVYKAIELGLVEASMVSYTERADHPWT